MTLREYVKAQRKRYGLTQVEAARKAGVGLRFVRDLEQGKESLQMDKVNQLLELFGAELGPVPLRREMMDADTSLMQSRAERLG
ncbi:helix-turn-helix transcriptional regulator [bacterium]|nr:helix-turn-helix transcriptional regulator [bacterium]